MSTRLNLSSHHLIVIWHHKWLGFDNVYDHLQYKVESVLTQGRSRVEWIINLSECILWSTITNPWSHQPMTLKYDEVIMVWCHHGPMRAEPKHLTHWMKQVCTSVNKPIPACIICRPDQKSSLYKTHSKSSLEFGLQSRQDLSKCRNVPGMCNFTSHMWVCVGVCVYVCVCVFVSKIFCTKTDPTKLVLYHINQVGNNTKGSPLPQQIAKPDVNHYHNLSHNQWDT